MWKLFSTQNDIKLDHLPSISAFMSTTFQFLIYISRCDQKFINLYTSSSERSKNSGMVLSKSYFIFFFFNNFFSPFKFSFMGPFLLDCLKIWVTLLTAFLLRNCFTFSSILNLFISTWLRVMDPKYYSNHPLVNVPITLAIICNDFNTQLGGIVGSFDRTLIPYLIVKKL